MTDAVNNQGGSINQVEYLKLFMQELSYQDPMKPVDNKEFMAQMAQFSALQVANESKETLERLLGMSTVQQSLTLLGKTVKINDSDKEFIVNNIKFEQGKPPQLTIAGTDGSGISKEVTLMDINEVM